MNQPNRIHEPRISLGYWLAWLALAVSLFQPAANYGRAMLNYRTLHNSDAAFILLFYRDLLARGRVDGWDLPTNPYFFPDMLLMVPIDLLTNNTNLTVNLFAALQLLLTGAGFVLLQRELFGKARIPQSLTLLAFTLCVLLIASGEHLFYYSALMPSHHFGVLVVVPFATIAMLRALQANKRANVLLFALTFLTSLSDFLYIIQFVLPAFFALLLWWQRLQMSWKRLLGVSGMLLFSAAAGHWLRQLLVSVQKFRIYVNIDHQTRQQSLADFGAWLVELAADDPFFAIFWLTSLVALVITLVNGIRAQTVDVGKRYTLPLVATLLMASGAASVAAMLASGNFENSASSRYILSAIYLPLFTGWPLWLATRLLHRGEQHSFTQDVTNVRWVSAAVTLVAVALLGYTILNMPLSALAAVPTHQDPVVACLQQETARRNLRYGLAEYWQAGYMSALARGTLHLAAVSEPLTPALWNSNRYDYELPFEFVISNADAEPQWQIEEAFLHQQFGPPDDSFRCESSTVFVYDRATNPQFRHWFRHHPVLATLAHVGDVVEFYGYSLPSAIGGRPIGLSMGASEQWEQPEGDLVRAFLQEVPAGSYAFAIDFFADNLDVGEWQIVAATADGLEMLYRAPLAATGSQVITGHVTLENKADVEVVVQYSGHGMLYVDRLRIARVDPTAPDRFTFDDDEAAPGDSSLALLSLVYPHAGSALESNEVDFVWQWTGQPLTPEQTFEVRLWRKGETIHYGAHDAAATQHMIRRVGDTYMLQLNLDGAYSVMQHGAGDYEWTVALVAIAPTYQDYQIEAAARPLSVLP